MNSKIKANILAMFNDRKYDTNSVNIINNELFSLKNKNGQISNIIYVDNITRTVQLRDFIKDLLSNLLSNISLDENNTLYIILDHKIKIKLLKIKLNFITILYSHDFRFNITNHVFVHKYVLLDADEKKIVTNKYGINNLPVLHVDDPMAKWYGYRIGDICKIDRSIGFIYRIVRG